MRSNEQKKDGEIPDRSEETHSPIPNDEPYFFVCTVIPNYRNSQSLRNEVFTQLIKQLINKTKTSRKAIDVLKETRKNNFSTNFICESNKFLSITNT